MPTLSSHSLRWRILFLGLIDLLGACQIRHFPCMNDIGTMLPYTSCVSSYQRDTGHVYAYKNHT